MTRLRFSPVRQEAKSQAGATLLETAIMIPLLLMLAIGLAEIGFLVIDHMAVANATREGARVGAAAGPYVDANGVDDADTVILRSVQQALCHIESGKATRMWIYSAEVDGSLPTNTDLINVYAAPVDGILDCNAGGAISFQCTVCPWDPADRDNVPPILDDIGVMVEFEYNPILGIFPFTDTLTLSDRAVMRIEPDTRG